MNVTIEETGVLAVVRLTGRGGVAALPPLENACTALARSGTAGILVDLAPVTRWSKAGLAGLVDLMTRWPSVTGRSQPALALCGLDQDSRKHLTSVGLDRVLPLHDDLTAGRAAAPFRALRLAGTSAVVLCDDGPETGPLGDVTPPALLDVLGRPVLGRLFDHLSEYGVTRTIVASQPGDAALSIRKACGTGAGLGLARMAGMTTFHTATNTSSVADALMALQRNHGAVDAETIVITAPTVTDLDLAALVEHHRVAGAEATLAMASGSDGSMRPSGIAVLTPAALQALEARAARDAGRSGLHRLDLGGALARADVRCATWATSARAIAPQTPRSYMALMAAILENRMPGQAPMGERVGRGLWMAPGADLGRRTRIEGPCWIGPAARVAQGATISGPAIVGAGSYLEGGSYLRNGMLWAGAEMLSGAIVDGMIAAADWAVSHRTAPGQPLNDMALDQMAGAATRAAAMTEITGGRDTAPTLSVARSA